MNPTVSVMMTSRPDGSRIERESQPVRAGIEQARIQARIGVDHFGPCSRCGDGVARSQEDLPHGRSNQVYADKIRRGKRSLCAGRVVHIETN